MSDAQSSISGVSIRLKGYLSLINFPRSVIEDISTMIDEYSNTVELAEKQKIEMEAEIKRLKDTNESLIRAIYALSARRY